MRTAKAKPAAARTAIWVDPDVARALKIVAAERGTTVKDLADAALSQWYKRQPEYRHAKTATA